MLRQRVKDGAICGLLCSVAALGLLLLLDRLQLAPFVPLNMANAVILLTPGDIATASIDTIGVWAKRIIVLVSIGAFLGLGAVLGILCALGLSRASSGSRRWVILGTLCGLAALTVTLLLHYSVPANTTPLSTATRSTLILATVYVLSTVTMAALIQTLAVGSARGTSSFPAQRRSFLVRSSVALMALAGGSTVLVQLAPRRSPILAGKSLPIAPLKPAERSVPLATSRPPTTNSTSSTTRATATADTQRATADPTRTTPTTTTPVTTPSPSATPTATSQPGFAIAPGTRPEVTTQPALYHVTNGTTDPSVDSNQWQLTIRGAVRQPYTMHYGDLLALPRYDQTSTLECISNQVGGSLIGNCNWNGVRLRDVLTVAGLQPGARNVVFRGADGYSDSLPLAIALDPTTMVAYGIDGQALEVAHGFPARIRVAGRYGIKNVKWVTDIEVVMGDYKGFWQQRGWSQPAIVETMATIDTGNLPWSSPNLKHDQGHVSLGGIAFAGTRGISKVELQIEDGEWREVELKPVMAPYSWRVWRYDWWVLPGRYRLTVRATDGAGQLQTMQIRAPHPEGATGYHTIKVDVV